MHWITIINNVLLIDPLLMQNAVADICLANIFYYINIKMFHIRTIWNQHQEII